MKKFTVILSLMLFAAFSTGCGNLGAELIDKLGEPDKIYHSGHDYLSGEYRILPKANSKDKPADMGLHGDSKGWKLTQNDSPAIHIYEFEPAKMNELFGKPDASAQCAGVAGFVFCKAPKGTRIKKGKIDTTMDTGYIAIMNDDFDHVEKK